MTSCHLHLSRRHFLFPFSISFLYSNIFLVKRKQSNNAFRILIYCLDFACSKYLQCTDGGWSDVDGCCRVSTNATGTKSHCIRSFWINSTVYTCFVLPFTYYIFISFIKLHYIFLVAKQAASESDDARWALLIIRTCYFIRARWRYHWYPKQFLLLKNN